MNGITETLLIASLIVASASLAQAVTGFGFALVLVPLLALFYDPRTVVIVSISLGLLCKIPLLAGCWRELQVLRILPLCVAAIIGSYFGTRLLLFVDPNYLKLAIGILVILFSVPFLMEWRLQTRREGATSLAVGLLSGLLNGSTSMGGPPVVLLGVNQGWSKEALRANLLGFFIVSNTSSLIIIALSGALTSEILQFDLMMIPGVLIGVLVGNWLFRVIPVSQFRRMVVLVVIATGLLSAFTSAQALQIL